MLNISKQGNSLLIQSNDNSQYPWIDGELSLPLNVVSYVLEDDTDYIVFRNAYNDEILFTALIDEVHINGNKTNKDDIIAAFDSVSNSSGGQGGSGSGSGVETVNGYSGAIILKTVNGYNLVGSGEITIESKEPDLSDYYTKSQVDNLIPTDYVPTTQLNDYYTKTQVDGLIPTDYLVESDLEGYALKSEIPTDYVKTTQLNDYYTKTQVDGLIPTDYVPTSKLNDYYTKDETVALIPTDHLTAEDLQPYYTKTEVDDLIDDLGVFDKNQYYTKEETIALIPTDHLTAEDLPTDYVTGITVTTHSEGYDRITPYTKAGTSISPFTIAWVNGQSILNKTANYDVTSNYYTKAQVDNKIPTDYVKTSQLTDYYTKSEVDNKIANGGNFDSTLYYTKTQTDNKITTSLSDYYNKTEIDGKFDNISSIDESKYYTKTEVDNLIPTDYLVESDLEGYALKSEIPTDYYTKSEGDGRIPTDYLVESDLDNYYTKTEVDNKIENGGNFDSSLYYTKTETDAMLEVKLEKVELTQAEYDALEEKDAYTLYVITDAEDNTSDFDPTLYYTKEEIDTDVISRITALETDLDGATETINEINDMVV